MWRVEHWVLTVARVNTLHTPLGSAREKELHLGTEKPLVSFSLDGSKRRHVQFLHTLMRHSWSIYCSCYRFHIQFEPSWGNKIFVIINLFLLHSAFDIFLNLKNSFRLALFFSRENTNGSRKQHKEMHNFLISRWEQGRTNLNRGHQQQHFSDYRLTCSVFCDICYFFKFST